MMETYEILTNRTSLYDHEAQADCRQTYERQILKNVQEKLKRNSDMVQRYTIMQSGIQRK